MNESVSQHYLADSLSLFRTYKQLAEKALAQLQDDEYFVQIDAESNSVAIIMKHLAGNMISRWTDFLTSDGEKPTRNRDLEFVIEKETSRAEIHDYWERGWKCVFEALEPLTEADFDRTVPIRGQPHTIVQAINRQLTHYAYHVGQIVFLAKHFRSADWRSLSIPRNRSAEFNAHLTEHRGTTRAEDRFKEVDNFAREVEKRSRQ